MECLPEKAGKLTGNGYVGYRSGLSNRQGMKPLVESLLGFPARGNDLPGETIRQESLAFFQRLTSHRPFAVPPGRRNDGLSGMAITGLGDRASAGMIGR
jgi:hypothetical protein